jgi:hypothetical protein
MTKQKKGSNATCLKGALDYQIWWLRFQVLARANGFDRIIKHREKYIDVVRDEAMAARMKNAKLHKEDLGDVGRSGGGKKLGRTAVRPRLFTIGLTKLNLFVKQFKA